MTISTIVLDWGNTLMRVFPQYEGAMLDWPEVAAVDGATEALSALHGTCRLVVGTNAANSNASQISAALARVGLDEWIDDIFTYNEIGSRKPDPAFYSQMERLLQVERDQIVMLGDEFIADVLGPSRAGWRAVWLNPEARFAPGLNPLQSAEIQNMAELPGIIDGLDMPSPSIALTWLQEQGTSCTLLMHVQMVAALAYCLAVELRRLGERVDPVLAHRGGLLHDVAKLSAKKLPGRPDHGKAASDFLLGRNQPVLAEIARRHLLFCIDDPGRTPRTWEEKLVYFADKLVDGGGLATIQTRLKAFKLRYPDDAERISQIEPGVLAMQQEIAGRLGWNPEEMLARLKQALWEN